MQQCGMASAECGVNALRIRRAGITPHSELRTPNSSRGFTYVALLAAIVIIGISMGAAGKYWSSVMQREREEELLFRGGQYRQAIERYYLAKAPHILPATIEQLLKDDRFPQAKRHLRQQYRDPITSEDFEIVHDLTKGNRITGVYSKSDREPLKKMEFAEADKEFENKMSYSEWKFLFTPPVAQPGRPGAPGIQPNAPSGWQGGPSFPK